MISCKQDKGNICTLVSIDWLTIFCCHGTFSTQCGYNIVDQLVLLEISTNQNWHFVQGWILITWEWPELFNTDRGQIWFFEMTYLRLSLGNQKMNRFWVSTSIFESRIWSTKFFAMALFCGCFQWIQSCGSRSLIDNFNISKLTLFTVMDWDNLRVARTLILAKVKCDCMKLSTEVSPWGIRIQFHFVDSQVHLKDKVAMSWESLGSNVGIGLNQPCQGQQFFNWLKTRKRGNKLPRESQLPDGTWIRTSCSVSNGTSFWKSHRIAVKANANANINTNASNAWATQHYSDDQGTHTEVGDQDDAWIQQGSGSWRMDMEIVERDSAWSLQHETDCDRTWYKLSEDKKLLLWCHCACDHTITRTEVATFKVANP